MNRKYLPLIVDLTQLRIPFSVWNPNGGGSSGEILIDKVRFEAGN